jgi:hypothetical protein
VKKDLTSVIPHDVDGRIGVNPGSDGFGQRPTANDQRLLSAFPVLDMWIIGLLVFTSVGRAPSSPIATSFKSRAAHGFRFTGHSSAEKQNSRESLPSAPFFEN